MVIRLNERDAIFVRRVDRMMSSSSVSGNESLRSRGVGVEIAAIGDTSVSVGEELIIGIGRE